VIRWPLIGAAALIAGWCSGFSVGLAKAEQQAHATVLSIGDRDTIRVQQGAKRITIRLACIDAPEMAQAPDGANARRYLQTRLRLGSSVTLKAQTVDRFGRTVAEVISGVNLNLALVEDGMAFAYRRYLGQCDAKAYLNAEVRAARRRIGVWRVPGGITRPWDFRRGRTAGRAGSGTESIPGGRRYRCSGIGSFARAQELLRLLRSSSAPPTGRLPVGHGVLTIQRNRDNASPRLNVAAWTLRSPASC
jgi:endonuclease YncB( thermonuclease family)